MGVRTSPAGRQVGGLKVARREGFGQRSDAAQTSVAARQSRRVVPGLGITHLGVFVFLYENDIAFVYNDNTTVFVFVFVAGLHISSLLYLFWIHLI